MFIVKGKYSEAKVHATIVEDEDKEKRFHKRYEQPFQGV